MRKMSDGRSFNRSLFVGGFLYLSATTGLPTFVSATPADARAKLEDPSSGAELLVKVKALPEYKKSESVSGALSSVGSDTLNNLMTLWTEKFSALHKGVNVQVEGKGSGTAPPALISGTAQIGPMSREMKSSEIEQFEAKFGYKPTKIRVAVDALGVFVHKDNPISGLTLQQVDAIFSKTKKAGAPADILTWGDLGMTGTWASKPISVYGRNSASGTYGFFKEHALKNGDFKDTVKEQPGSASVVQSVGVDEFSMGYSGIGYKTSEVRALPLRNQEDSQEYFTATPDNAYSGDYPLSRFLFVYINRAPGKPMDKLTGEFLKFIVSKEGQEVVVKDGYYPLPPEISKEELAQLN